MILRGYRLTQPVQRAVNTVSYCSSFLQKRGGVVNRATHALVSRKHGQPLK